jgi:hypothetical protein
MIDTIENLKADIEINRYQTEKMKAEWAKESEGFAESFPKLKKTFKYKKHGAF